MRYVEVLDQHHAAVALAEAAARGVAQALGIPAPAVRWFRPIDATDDQEIAHAPRDAAWGWFSVLRPDEVWVHADRVGGEIVETVAHEVVHAWQARQGHEIHGARRSWFERQAEAIATRWGTDVRNAS